MCAELDDRRGSADAGDVCFLYFSRNSSISWFLPNKQLLYGNSFIPSIYMSFLNDAEPHRRRRRRRRLELQRVHIPQPSGAGQVRAVRNAASADLRLRSAPGPALGIRLGPAHFGFDLTDLIVD